MLAISQELVGKRRTPIKQTVKLDVECPADVETVHWVQIDHYIIVSPDRLIVYRQGKVSRMLKLEHPLVETTLVDQTVVGICLDTSTIRFYDTSTLDQVRKIEYGSKLQTTRQSHHFKLIVFKKSRAVGLVRLQTIKNTAILFDYQGNMTKYQNKHGVPLKFDQEGELVSFHQRCEDVVLTNLFFSPIFMHFQSPIGTDCTVMHVQMVDNKNILIGCNTAKLREHPGQQSVWFLVDRGTQIVSKIQYRSKIILSVLEVDTHKNWVIFTQCNIKLKPTQNLVILDYLNGLVVDTPMEIRQKSAYNCGTVINYDSKMDKLQVLLMKTVSQQSLYIGLLHRLQIQEKYGQAMIHQVLDRLNQQID